MYAHLYYLNIIFIFFFIFEKFLIYFGALFGTDFIFSWSIEREFYQRIELWTIYWFNWISNSMNFVLFCSLPLFHPLLQKYLNYILLNCIEYSWFHFIFYLHDEFSFDSSPAVKILICECSKEFWFFFFQTNQIVHVCIMCHTTWCTTYVFPLTEKNCKHIYYGATIKPQLKNHNFQSLKFQTLCRYKTNSIH